jgi:peptidoglycan hydrolase-like protein with peptidoglycan-binding domain
MTIKQRQCLLFYLGYYVGEIDGSWGTLSKTATKAFQKDFGLPSNGVCDADTEKALKHSVAYGVEKKHDSSTKSAVWSMVKHFTRDEFRCPCGKCGGFPVEPEDELVLIAEEMREAFGSAVIIVPPDGHSGGSGVRCQSYNDSLSGSAKNSRHLLGKAFDFSAPGESAVTIENYLTKLKNSGKIRYWYKICSGSYHLDIN